MANYDRSLAYDIAKAIEPPFHNPEECMKRNCRECAVYMEER